jgi:hypothetical protein
MVSTALAAGKFEQAKKRPLMRGANLPWFSLVRRACYGRDLSRLTANLVGTSNCLGSGAGSARGCFPPFSAGYPGEGY